MQEEFNTFNSVVYNTYQCYLKGSLERIQSDMDHATMNRYVFGGKLVRGAYMKRERERALQLGYQNPVHDDKISTDANYDKLVLTLLNSQILKLQ